MFALPNPGFGHYMICVLIGDTVEHHVMENKNIFQTDTIIHVHVSIQMCSLVILHDKIKNKRCIALRKYIRLIIYTRLPLRRTKNI